MMSAARKRDSGTVSGLTTSRYRDLGGELIGERSLLELTEALVKAGVSRPLAERRARERLGIVAERDERAERLRADAREDEHLLKGDALVTALGGRVYRLTQKRASKQSLGLPDRLYVFPRRARWYTWEAKASWGVLSEAQATFAAEAALCNMPHVVGELSELQSRFVDDGLCEVTAEGTVEPIRGG